MKKILFFVLIVIIFVSGCITSDPNIETYKIPYTVTNVYSDGIHSRTEIVQKELTLELYPDGKACTYEGPSYAKINYRCGIYQNKNGKNFYINISGSIQNDQPWMKEGNKIIGPPLDKRVIVYTKNI